MKAPGSIVVSLIVTGAALSAQKPADQQGTWPPAVHLPDLACAPAITLTRPTSTLRVSGSLQPERHIAFVAGQTITISGGTAAGVAPGQQYYVRRLPRRFGAKTPDPDHPASVHTVGSVTILAADADTATATITHMCDAMLIGDYLEPFVAPVAQKVFDGRLNYENLGRITGGDEDRSSTGVNQYTTIDRGTDHGVRLGARFIVLRDKHVGPLVEVGEGVVLQVRPTSSTVQITRALDAIYTGDYVAISK
jgi:hypothetical protein